MLVTGISTTSHFATANPNVVSKRDQIQKDFQQLGQDLQSGDLSAAQSDYASLEQLVPKLGSSSPAGNSDPRVQAFNQLEKDMQSGDVSAAQQDYSNIQQMLQHHAERFHHNPHVNTGTQPVGEKPQATTSGVSVTA